MLKRIQEARLCVTYIKRIEKSYKLNSTNYTKAHFTKPCIINTSLKDIRKGSKTRRKNSKYGAADGTRTRNNQLGRLMLYQLNYRRKKLVGVTGFEPATLCSQSRCATKLRYTPQPLD